jgi:hypothetical protein
MDWDRYINTRICSYDSKTFMKVGDYWLRICNDGFERIGDNIDMALWLSKQEQTHDD